MVKNTFKMIVVALLVLFFSCVNSSIVFSSGWNDYMVPLPNGYQLVRTNAPSIFIFRPYIADGIIVENSCVVPPKIVGLNVYGYTVFGETVNSEDADDWGQQKPGFFILDTRKHQVQLGLDKETWLSSLKNFGVNKKPPLKKPSRSLMLISEKSEIAMEERILDLERQIEVLKYIILIQGEEAGYLQNPRNYIQERNEPNAHPNSIDIRKRSINNEIKSYFGSTLDKRGMPITIENIIFMLLFCVLICLIIIVLLTLTIFLGKRKKIN